ncbi:probable pectinesterase 29 [Rosa chinensis]|uniref:probable pectinesterase 29 n=1 Tax=Rosa chinensis TaxID=74649 RepID=UPI000D08D181|nr:probable pectinesterase 29 [Rosa chinensis]
MPSSLRTTGICIVVAASTDQGWAQVRATGDDGSCGVGLWGCTALLGGDRRAGDDWASGLNCCILSIGTLCANITIFSEKVEIKKPYIILEGDRDQQTVIQYGDGGNVVTSPTFKLNADNFVARYIVFKNTYDNLPSKLDASGVNTTWAPAAAINGDRASFYHCSFSSLQDTLTDAKGRHYFYDCKISGAIDFIWGNAQSIYENCQINSLASKIAPRVGFITAQARESPEENTGFVFKNCHVTGSGPMYLGRAHTNHARVLFAGTTMDNVIRAEGWDGARFKGSENLISFSEANCRGPGANMSKRVKWEKKLSDQEVLLAVYAFSSISSSGADVGEGCSAIGDEKAFSDQIVAAAGHGSYGTGLFSEACG